MISKELKDTNIFQLHKKVFLFSFGVLAVYTVYQDRGYCLLARHWWWRSRAVMVVGCLSCFSCSLAPSALS